MMSTEVNDFLKVSTPREWVQTALRNIDLLLVDHANCEKKAASTAISLLYRYVEETSLLKQLSRLAREELRHFEQVVSVIESRKIEYVQLSASRYAARLHELIRKEEPYRMIDTLIVCAIVEARSCERFGCLIGNVEPQLSDLYENFLLSEQRHFHTYLDLAGHYGADELEERLPVFLAADNESILSIEKNFRFHSGPIG